MVTELAYHLISTPFGQSAFTYRVNPFKIIRVNLPDRSLNLESTLRNLGQKCPKPTDSHPKAIFVLLAINEYFAGNPKKISKLSFKWLFTRRMTSLQNKVLEVTAQIPYGQLKTYKEIANEIAHPGAYRFVGTALSKNPFPIIVPCHRVHRN